MIHFATPPSIAHTLLVSIPTSYILSLQRSRLLRLEVKRSESVSSGLITVAVSRRSVRAKSIATALSGTSTEIYSQGTAIDFLPHKRLLTLNSTLHIDEVSVSETSWLAGTSINCNTDVDDASNITEELVEICVGHLEGEVADEEGLGGGVFSVLALGLVHVVDDEAAAFEDGLVLGFDGGGGLVDGLEFDIAESVNVVLGTILRSRKYNSK